jgi:hypothetical protein
MLSSSTVIHIGFVAKWYIRRSNSIARIILAQIGMKCAEKEVVEARSTIIGSCYTGWVIMREQRGKLFCYRKGV